MRSLATSVRGPLGGRAVAVSAARGQAPGVVSPPTMVARLRAELDVFRVSLFVLTVLTVSRIHEQYPVIAKLRPAMVLTGLAVATAYAQPRLLSKVKLLHTWPAKLMAAFAVLVCVSTIFGISPGNSGQWILNVYGKTIIFAFLIVVAVRSVKDLHLIVWAFVIATALLVYTAQYVFELHNYNGYSRLSNGNMYDANDLGLVLIVGLALTLLALQTAGPLGKAFCAVCLLGVGASIAKSGSRGAFVGLSAMGLALLLLLSQVQVWKRVAFLVAVFAAMYIWAPPGYWKQMQTIEDPKADYNWDSINGRRHVAERGIGYMMDYPAFGLGIHNFAKAECFISDKARYHVSGTGIRCTPPHNAYIEAGAEAGLPGLALWLLMIPGAVVSLLLLRRRMPREWATSPDAEARYLFLAVNYMAVAFAGFAVGSFFLSFAWTDVTYLLVAMWAGLEVAVEEKLTRSGLAPAPVAQPRGLGRGRRALARA